MVDEQQCNSAEAGVDLPGGDLRRQCSDSAPFMPCSALSVAECMQRCARRPRCFAYVYTALLGLCYLKDAPAAIFGTPVGIPADTSNADTKHLGRCIRRTPTVRSTAVCMSGQPRGFGQTAPSIRTNVLEAWDADAFLVAQSSSKSASVVGQQVGSASSWWLGPGTRGGGAVLP